METKLLNFLKKFIFLICIGFTFLHCKNSNKNYDATGLFEADEIVVSSEINGKLIQFNLEEGAQLTKDSLIGQIDPIQYQLQKEQIEASIQAVGNKNVPSLPQINILESQISAQQEQRNAIQIQLNTAITEKNRIDKLVKGDAAPAKQLDDVNAQIDLLNQQIKVLKSQIDVSYQQIKSQKQLIAAQNNGINSEKNPLEKRKDQAEDILNKTKLRSPIDGTVLSKYANEFEVVGAGKPLYKIANLNQMKLKVYISGAQLSSLKLNQDVKVYTDFGSKEQREYSGKVIWISDKAEFTPKTIQTKEERVNLVYALKIKVNNDGYLKLGMYGEVKI